MPTELYYCMCEVLIFKECLAEFILMANIFSRLNPLNHQLHDNLNIFYCT